MDDEFKKVQHECSVSKDLNMWIHKKFIKFLKIIIRLKF